MPKTLSLVVLSVALCVSMISCSNSEHPVYPDPGLSLSTLSFCENTVVNVNNYLVAYQGRTFDGTNTTFTYTVTSTGLGEDMNHFALEIPDCAPALVAYSPTNSANVNTDQDTGIYGLEWHLFTDHSDLVSRTYSYTFAGNVPQGFVLSSVKAGNSSAVGEVPGPCKGYLLTGRVWIDTDSTGNLGSYESATGLPNVTVTVSRADCGTVNLTTDPEGYYEVLVGTGTYTVSISSVTPEDDFNEELFESFNSTTALSGEVIVPPEPEPLNFGFKPRTKQLIYEVENGFIETTGYPTKFWTAEIRSAINGGGKPTYTADQIRAFLLEIQTYAFDDPFQFTPGNEFAEALDILKERPKDDLTGLIQEILAFELNTAAGLGIQGNEGLQEALISYSESVYIRNTTPAAGGFTSLAGTEPTDDEAIGDTKNLLNLLNRGGGGGPVQ